jgi:hypothetical protein
MRLQGRRNFDADGQRVEIHMLRQSDQWIAQFRTPDFAFLLCGLKLARIG